MELTATYICPVRGLDGLEAPEPSRIETAAGIAADLGLERLYLPVLEEALLRAPRVVTAYLDGLVAALDRMEKKGLGAMLTAPAGRLLGLAWGAPYLASGWKGAQAPPIFLDGKVRRLRPYDWWADPAVLEKRIRVFRECVGALSGHPALGGWLLMDRALEWNRPSAQVADWMLRSCLGEIRDKGSGAVVYLGVGWSELLDPQIVRGLAKEVDGLRLGGMEHLPEALGPAEDFFTENLAAGYLGTMARWLFDRPVEIEIGYRVPARSPGAEEGAEAAQTLAASGVAAVSRPSLADPEPALRQRPPWVLRPGLDRVGLLDAGMEPKAWVPAWLDTLKRGAEAGEPFGFIDLSRNEYLADPMMHLQRLWGHFRDDRVRRHPL